jgi:predicted DNA-binding transcriptional regulator YafY
MKRLQNLIWIANKLSHRAHLTTESIARHCEVSRRTAFRYISILSSAGIPLHYDPNSGHYQIDPEFRGFTDSMDVVDALLCVVALHNLSIRLDKNYGEQIQALINRIEMRFPFSLIDSQLLSADESPLHSLQSSDFKENLNLLILQAAIKFNRSVVVRDGKGGNPQTIKLGRPRLTLKDAWLVGSRDSDDDLLPVKDITIVSVTKGA